MKTTLVLVLFALLAVMACHNATTTPPPVVPIAVGNPADGAVLGDPQTITIATGQGFTFTQVDFFIDSTLVKSDSIPPFQYDWNIFALQSGTNHTIYIIGFTADSTFTSSLVHVRIEYAHGFSFVSTYQPGSQHAIGVTNFFGVLFVSAGEAGLEVLDITNKALPHFRSRLVTSGQTLRSAVLFPNVYIAERNQGMEMANFENVDSLAPSHSYQPQNLVKGVAISDNFIFSVENNGLSILAPLTLLPYSRLTITQDQLNYAVARHDTAFIVGDNSFYIVNCTNPTTPDIISTYNNLNLAKSVAITDTFAFIANGSDGVIALSISHPTNPLFLARFNPGQIMTSVASGDGLLFAGSNAGDIFALVYTTPGALTSFDNFNVTNIVEEIKFGANYLYVAANSNVYILKFVP